MGSFQCFPVVCGQMAEAQKGKRLGRNDKNGWTGERYKMNGAEATISGPAALQVQALAWANPSPSGPPRYRVHSIYPLSRGRHPRTTSLSLLSLPAKINPAGLPGFLQLEMSIGPSLSCCGKEFRDSKAVEQHIRDSPRHRPQSAPHGSLTPAPKDKTDTIPNLANSITPQRTRCSCGKHSAVRML